jgi:hypothetical protein
MNYQIAQGNADGSRTERGLQVAKEIPHPAHHEQGISKAGHY